MQLNAKLTETNALSSDNGKQTYFLDTMTDYNSQKVANLDEQKIVTLKYKLR